MVGAKVALAGGLLLLLAAFGLGTQPRSASVRHVPYDCGATIAASWLAPGSPDLTPGPAAPADERADTGGIEDGHDDVVGSARVLALEFGVVYNGLRW